MKLTLALIASTLVLAACAGGPGGAGHERHAAPAAERSPGSGAMPHAHMDKMMQSMREMHGRMQAARTPEERERLMQEQMKLMHEGMGAMARMHADCMRAKPAP